MGLATEPQADATGSNRCGLVKWAMDWATVAMLLCYGHRREEATQMMRHFL